MTSHYQTMCRDAADRLESTIRATPCRVYLYAIHTQGADLPGRFEIVREADPTPPMPCSVIRPRAKDPAASDWRWIPFRDFYHHIERQCRSEPILPIA